MSFEQINELDSLLEHIDELQKRVNALKIAQSDAYARIMENWAVESTYNSNNIEGSTLSLGDTALVYDGAHVDAPADDIRQAEGGFAALKFLQKELDEGVQFSEGLIKRAHELVYAEANDIAARGNYRRVEVEITGTNFQPAPAAYVDERMQSLVAAVNKSKKHPAINAALFHLEFESIHPFVNANGRTGRLMSNFLLMRSEYEPINIQAESRARYIAAIRAFQNEDDPYPFVAFFCINLSDRLDKIIKKLSPSDAEAKGAHSSAINDFLARD
jgi:Fic family protein